jgi:hypothetical protein
VTESQRQQPDRSLLPWVAWVAVVGAAVGVTALGLIVALAFDDASAAAYGLPLGIAGGSFLGSVVGGVSFIVIGSFRR